MITIKHCEHCGKVFKSYNPTPRYCSLKCKGEFQRASIDEKMVIGLYLSGMTQNEVATELKTSQKVVFNILRRNSIKARKAAKRNQQGIKNSIWKGDLAGYEAFHIRVGKLRGKPAYCERCGKSNPDACYDWANLSGNYHDPFDYIRLCRSCHWKMDKKILNIKWVREKVMPNV